MSNVYNNTAYNTVPVDSTAPATYTTTVPVLPVVDRKYHRTTEHVTGPTGKDRLPEIFMGDVKTAGTGHHVHVVRAPVISAPLPAREPIPPAPVEPLAEVSQAPRAVEPVPPAPVEPLAQMSQAPITSEAPLAQSSEVPLSRTSDPLIHEQAPLTHHSTVYEAPADAVLGTGARDMTQPVGFTQTTQTTYTTTQPLGDGYGYGGSSNLPSQPVGSDYGNSNDFASQPVGAGGYGYGGSSNLPSQSSGSGYDRSRNIPSEPLGAGYGHSNTQPAIQPMAGGGYLEPCGSATESHLVKAAAPLHGHPKHAVFQDAARAAQEWHTRKEDQHREAEARLAANEMDHQKQFEEHQKKEIFHSQAEDRHIQQQEYHQQQIAEHAAKLQEHESEADRHRDELEQNRFAARQEKDLKEEARLAKEEHKELKEDEADVHGGGGFVSKLKDVAHKAKAAISGKH